MFCDQKNVGGGWTVVQKRLDGSVDFHRNWSDYKNGFGELNGEFWLGLEKIHRLTKSPSKLRVDLEDFDGKTAYAEYYMFVVATESKKYQLSVRNYSGKLFEANKSNCFNLTNLVILVICIKCSVANLIGIIYEDPELVFTFRNCDSVFSTGNNRNFMPLLLR